MNKPREADHERRVRRLREQAAAWYVEQQDQPDTRQRAAFLAWLRSSPSHVAEYLAIAQMHGDLRAAAVLEAMPIAELVEQARREPAVVPLRRHDGVPAAADAAQRRWHAGSGRRRSGWIAACAVMLAVAWLVVAKLSMETGGEWQNYAADAAALRTIPLADGSVVQLDRNSAIRVNFDAHRRRIEVLRGNALFDVGKDPARPLLVSVGGHVLQDIGTVFEVKRAAGNDILTVISGRVRVWPESPAWSSRIGSDVGGEAGHGDALAEIGSGEQVQWSGAAISPVHAVAVSQATDWLPDDIGFQRATIGEVARRFNAYTSTPLSIEDAHIADMRISGVFHAHNPQGFVAFLSALPGVAVVHERDRIRIVARTGDATPPRL